MRIWIWLFPILLLLSLRYSMANHVDECDALLQFSNSFTLSKAAAGYYCIIESSKTSYPKMASWKNGTDCCSWDGVRCDAVTNQVTGLDLSCSWLLGPLLSNSTLFSLINLRHLNLAGNYFAGSQISPRFGVFTRMAHLNLSHSGFSGPIPLETISHLSNLTTLDFSSNSGLTIEERSFTRLLRNLTQLRELLLDFADMSEIPLISLKNLSSTLTSLSLCNCDLRGIFPIDVFHLPNLQSLSLSYNNDLTGTLPQTNWTCPLISLDLHITNFHGSIPASLGNLTSLNSLDLSDSGLTGPIPPTLGNLDHLTYLKFGGNNPIGTVDFEMFARLKNLQYLSFDGSKNLTVVLQSDGNCSFPKLKVLDLFGCNLTKFPYFLRSSAELEELQLMGNMISGRIPEWFWRVVRDTLRILLLPVNNFTGDISSSVCHLSSLDHLSLSDNRLSGTIPICLGKLGSLSKLDLSNNLLEGPLPRSLANCTKLQDLDVSENGIYDTFPKWLINATYNMHYLDLQSNKFHGVIEVPISNISHLMLFENNFTGEIPSSICQVSSLEELSLSSNKLSGALPRCLGNLSSLSKLSLGNNLLQGPLPRSLANCSIEFLDVSNNGISDTFPNWLVNFTISLRQLNLQANKFYGVLEVTFPPQLFYLNLSNNNFYGQLPRNFLLNSSLKFIDLSSNSFDGPLPIPPPTILSYFLSNNKFWGGIPYQVCNATGLNFINLSNNSLTGTIPHCILNFGVLLVVLDLRANKFTGEIPEIFIPKANFLTIRLSQNQLRGTIPQSLARCEILEVLDLSENELEGRFPNWLDTLPNLQVLSLRSNKFHGPVDSSSITDHPFPKLRIFDLSINSFLGPLPTKYLANLIAMKDVEKGDLQYMGGDSYRDSVVVQMKGSEIELVRILTVFTTIDLSDNFFEGEIPEVIGDLKAIKGLNFSHNNLSGEIPSSVGNLTNLEWLDLSSNNLNGKIPRGLADLVSLSCLNLSNNHLMGPIPQSTQFDTFNNSFDGNPGLCGRPLQKACENDTGETDPSTYDEEDETEFDNWIEWRAVLMGCGCGVVFGISAGYIMLETGRPRWLARMFERKRSRKTIRPNKNVSPRNHGRRSTRGR